MAEIVWGSKLESGLSKRSVEYLHTLLHAALKQAVKWELVPRNAAEAVDPPRSDKKERPTFTLEETRLFLKTAKRDRFYALYVLAIHTGMRRGELLGLKWDDVDLDRGSCKSSVPLLPGARPSISPSRRRDAVG